MKISLIMMAVNNYGCHILIVYLHQAPFMKYITYIDHIPLQQVDEGVMSAFPLTDRMNQVLG